MSKKLPSLSAALAETEKPKRPPRTVKPLPKKSIEKKVTEVPSARAGSKQISGHFSPEASKQMKLLALQNDTTVQELMREALNDLFVKYGKSPIA